MSGKRVAIVQSNYIPWKGYFDLIRAVDEFITLDDAQFTRRDWRNRNIIKTAHGMRWLTIPVASKGRFTQTIAETEIAEPSVAGKWAEEHWASLHGSYARAKHFAAYAPEMAALYDMAASERRLSAVNLLFLRGISGMLGINTPIRPSGDYPHVGARTERLVSLCLAAGASVYLSGPSAEAYLEKERFAAVGIEVIYADYSAYPEYPQLHGKFEHGVTILDLMFNMGADAKCYMKDLL